MTIREFFGSKDFLVIHCNTEEKAKRLLKAFSKAGYYWTNNKRYTEETYWDVYVKDTCYSNTGAYADIDFYKDEGWQILEFEEIEFEDESPESCVEETQSIFDIAEDSIEEDEPEEDMERDKRIIEETLKRCAKFFNITHCLCTYTYEYSGKKVTLYTNEYHWWVGWHAKRKAILEATLSEALSRDNMVVDIIELKGTNGHLDFEE